ncbi:MAG: Ig-like domain-containing protein, partial [Promethearchaeota archaeon]
MKFGMAQVFSSVLRLKKRRSSNKSMIILSITLCLILFLGCFSYTAAYDIRKPEVTITSPSNNDYVAGEVDIIAHVKTYQGIYNVTLSFDNGNTWEELLQNDNDMFAGVFTCDWNTSQVLDGTYNITIMVRDTYGKIDTSLIIINVDNTAPNLLLLYPSDISTTILSEKTLLTVRSTDEGSGVSKVRYRIDETLWIDMSNSETDDLFRTELNTTKYSDGVHALKLESFDVMGNRKAVSYNITINNVPKGNKNPSNSIFESWELFLDNNQNLIMKNYLSENDESNLSVIQEEYEDHVIPNPEESQSPSSEFKSSEWLKGTGMHFELTDSNYQNIILDSSEPIQLVLEASPRLVSFHVEMASEATSTQITLSNFEPNTKYYRYQEGYLMEEFTTDSNGQYTYMQDISEHHHVYIQEEPSTLYINSDYTFTDDVNEAIVVEADNIVIDGNGYTLQGSGYGYGFYLNGRTNVTITNVTITSWT